MCLIGMAQADCTFACIAQAAMDCMMHNRLAFLSEEALSL
jgi:hypothetical protein